MLHHEQDRLRIYPMCERDAPDRLAVLGAAFEDPPTHYVV